MITVTCLAVIVLLERPLLRLCASELRFSSVVLTFPSFLAGGGDALDDLSSFLGLPGPLVGGGMLTGSTFMGKAAASLALSNCAMELSQSLTNY